jgi:hypothetical protein
MIAIEQGKTVSTEEVLALVLRNYHQATANKILLEQIQDWYRQ